MWKLPMKYLFLAIVLLAKLATTTYGQPSLSFISHHQLTPDAFDTTGVFCRTFYHEQRNKYYTVFAGRANYLSNQQFSWREYDTGFNPTGNHGTLAGFQGNVGDYAMVQVGTNYFHVTGTPGNWSYKLSKYDEDFNLVGSVSFAIDSSDSKADMLLNFTNGRLIIGAFHVPGTYHPTMPAQSTSWQPVMHKWEYDTLLNPVAPPAYLNESFTTWGASCVFNNGYYNIISFYKWLGQVNPQFDLNVYRYDSNWNFVDSIPLNDDGQWSQGVIWDGTHYIIAYHSGHTHQAGNVTVAIYDPSWNMVYDTVITPYSNFIQFSTPPLFTTDYNANRPFLTKVNDTLVVSYDVDDYQLQNWNGFFIHGNRWQAHTMQFRINGATGIEIPSQKFEETLYPNPTGSSAKVSFPNPGKDLFTLTLIDTKGNVIMSINSNDDQIEIPCDKLHPEVYFYRIESKSEKHSGKLVVN